MFFTAIHQMMTDGVDLTLVIRKANGQLTVSTLPKSNGLKDEAADRQRTSAGTRCGIPASHRPADTESGGADYQHGAVRGADGKSRVRKQGGKGCKGQGVERGEGEAGEVRETPQESGRTDYRQKPQGCRHRSRAGTPLRQAARPEED